MKVVQVNMEVGKLNDNYDRIVNCQAVKPPYEVQWSYSKEFFLDKRWWLKEIYGSVNWQYEFVDYLDLAWKKYYLYRQNVWNKVMDYVWYLNDQWELVSLTPDGFESSGCNRLCRGHWAKWKLENTQQHLKVMDGQWKEYVTVKWVPKDFPKLPWYEWVYLRFRYEWNITLTVEDDIWKYIIFRNGLLQWATTRIENIEVDPNDWHTYVYILGTNKEWWLPYEIVNGQQIWSLFDVYDEYGPAIMMGHKTWITVIPLVDNAGEIWVGFENAFFTIQTKEPIIDIQPFQWSIFALTENRVMYTYWNYHSNMNFLWASFKIVDGGESLFVIGKAMIIFADTNMIASTLEDTATWNYQYAFYNCNYAGKPFSKHSYIFDDQTIHILQSNRQLVECDVKQYDANTFDVITKNVMENTRGLFVEYLEPNWVVTAKMTNRFMNYVMRYWNELSKTRVFQYDKQLKHWLINEYECAINKFSEHIIWKWFVTKEEWYVDFPNTWAKEYEQNVIFSFNPWPLMAFVQHVRTMFGMIDKPIDVLFNAEMERWGKADVVNLHLHWYEFDTRFSNTQTADDLVWNEDAVSESDDYGWTFVSLQQAIMKTWRMLRIQYSWIKRFVLGHSALFYDESKPWINEISNNT